MAATSWVRWCRDVLAPVSVALVVVLGAAWGPTAAGASSALPTAVPGLGEVVAPAPGGTAKLRIPLRLSAPSASPVRVHWATEVVAGTASAPEPQAPATDYRSAHGVLVFAPGKTFADATIDVTGDAAGQFEYLAVQFSHPTDATVGGFAGLGFGLIDPSGVPPAPSVSFDSPVNFPYSSGSPVAVVLSHPSSHPITVDYVVSAGPGALLFWGEWVGAASSFSPASGQVTFAPGQIQATVAFTVDPTNLDECQPTFGPANCYPEATVTLVNPVGATIGATPSTDLPEVPN